ncbi:MAG: outer membrane lipoprotein carrier protein LolA [Planctomycetota bacterium]|nr:MAG: outer membrane lipoprotein carrier protein LolA [Planctomycetota bacterium]
MPGRSERKALALALIVLFLIGCSSIVSIGAEEKAEKDDSSSEDEKTARSMGGKELGALLDRLEKNLGNLSSLKVSFEQEKHLSIFTDVVKSKGVCVFKKPDKLRFEITEPFQSVVITSGKSVAKYEKMEDEWKKIKSAGAELILKVTGQIASWLQGRFRGKSTLYAISAVQGKTATIVLTPKSKKFRKRISKIELGISADETRITFVTIRESGGDYSTMVFSDEERDAGIEDSLFNTDGDAPAPLESEEPAGDAPGEKKDEGGAEKKKESEKSSKVQKFKGSKVRRS